MSKIGSRAAAALYAAVSFKQGNTVVEVFENVTTLSLHGSTIAYLYNDPEHTLSITHQGYATQVTKARLNALRGVSIVQSSGVWYLNDLKWNGALVNVSENGRWHYV